ncbi:MAG: hypothetical protein J6W79_03275, partial [Alphaproteobacteria bacterium]|nr:hypothetical protein [Alphaproteobacteria bacterium]
GTSNGNTQDTQMSQGMIEMSHAYCDAYAKNGAVWNSWNNTCNCDKIKNQKDKEKCVLTTKY